MALRVGGYQLVELKPVSLRDACATKTCCRAFSLPELASSFSARELSSAGVSERDLEATGFSQLDIRCEARTLFGFY